MHLALLAVTLLLAGHLALARLRAYRQRVDEHEAFTGGKVSHGATYDLIGRILSAIDGLFALLPATARDLGSRLSAAPSRQLLFTKAEVEAHFSPDSWQRSAYDEFQRTITATGPGRKTFPCVYATMGYRANEHRYVFCESSNPSEPRNLRILAPALKQYLSIARDLGANTSLVIVSAPADVRSGVTDFSKQFWRTLRGLHDADRSAWPETIPSSMHDAKWTFCFDGVPIFPILLTPAHDRRWSRHASVPIIALQPKWILDSLLATPEKREAAQNKVRKLLAEYDSVGISPDLTSYGAEGTSEARQLALLDENEQAPMPSPIMPLR